MRIALSTSNPSDYQKFLRIKRLPKYHFDGCYATFPDEYAGAVGVDVPLAKHADYAPSPWMFDYQRDITAMAIARGKFAVFADCGLGKTIMELDFARHAASALPGRKVLIVTPLMVIPQMIEEARRFYGDSLAIEQVRANRLNAWLAGEGGQIGITNYDALTNDVEQCALGALVLDESSMLKSHYGSWAGHCIRLGSGLRYKLACTGTPAPNDRIEYANHAVFLDEYPTVNSFLAKFFINRGETGERWELKKHALEPFYRSLSHWSIFLSNPSIYGWGMDTSNIPPIHVHIHDVPMTAEQSSLAQDATGKLFASGAGGITTRATLSQLAKGKYDGERVDTNKPAYIRRLVDSWPKESTIIWCRFNDEQARMTEMFPDAANIAGDTPEDERLKAVADFKAGRVRILISKPRILGFGLNLQIATRHVFSGLQDSYEEYYQAVKRSNRIGSKLPLNVHIPITDIERPMIDSVLRKARMVQADTAEQERIFMKARKP